MNVYEELVDIRNDEKAFDEKANQIINDFISSLPKERQQRARAIHFRISTQLRNINDPIARMNKMVEIFWDGVEEFRNVLNGEVETKEEVPANVINISVEPK